MLSDNPSPLAAPAAHPKSALQASPGEAVLHVDLGSYEGPLDLLLDLARQQKVDLAAISVLALAEQYLTFLDSAREGRIEVAADYLVMAAWLTYLKSRMLLPPSPNKDEPSGQALADALQFRLLRLDAMRVAAERLLTRPRLGLAVHPRGEPEVVPSRRTQHWEAGLFDLLKAYADRRERETPPSYVPFRRKVLPLAEARARLEAMLGMSIGWLALDSVLSLYPSDAKDTASIRASSFSASLEVVRQGRADLRQDGAFGPVHLRSRRKPGSR